MRLSRCIAFTLALVFPVLLLGAPAIASVTLTPSPVPRFDPDDQEKLARLTHELHRLRGHLERLAGVARAAEEKGWAGAANVARRRIALGKRRLQALESEVRALQSRPAEAQRGDSLRRPPHPRPDAARARAGAERAAARDPVQRARTADRARAEGPLRDRMQRLLRVKARLERRLKATHAKIARLQKVQEAAKRRDRGGKSSAVGRPVGRPVGPIQAGVGGAPLLAEMRQLRRDVHRLTQTMERVLGAAAGKRASARPTAEQPPKGKERDGVGASVLQPKRADAAKARAQTKERTLQKQVQKKRLQRRPAAPPPEPAQQERMPRRAVTRDDHLPHSL